MFIYHYELRVSFYHGTYNILKSTETVKKSVNVSSHYTDKMRREYYLNLPQSFKMTKVPTTIEIKTTQGSGRTPVRLGERTKEQYYVEAFGKVIHTSSIQMKSCTFVTIVVAARLPRSRSLLTTNSSASTA